METWIANANDVLWTYLLIGALLSCAVWFSLKTRWVQFRMLGEMIRLLADARPTRADGSRHISSFQAFAVSIASRVGTGNLAGVATALTVGGPGAIFWMWTIALLGASSAFVESTLAQLFKIRGPHSFVGGPAYYMKKGLGRPGMGILFAILLIFTFGFAFNSVQSNTICAAFDEAFALPPALTGAVLTGLTLAIVFGGIRRIARVSAVIVPFMAIAYVILALSIVLLHADRLPSVIALIVRDAFGWHQAIGGSAGMALMQGIRRGLFSNEAGMGSAPNVAATADTTHPAKQGLIQTLGVFTDTLLICTCTAFIILCSGADLAGGSDGIRLTQQALTLEIGRAGEVCVAVAILFFAYSSILGNYYYGEANVRYVTRRPWIVTVYRLLVGAMVMFGSLASLDLAWSLADLTMGLMTLCNLAAIVLLGKYAFRLLDDYRRQKRAGVKEPRFERSQLSEIAHELDCW